MYPMWPPDHSPGAPRGTNARYVHRYAKRGGHKARPYTALRQNLVLAPPPPLRPPPQEPPLELLPPLLHEELLLSSDESLRELPLNQPSLRIFSSFTWPQSMQT